MRKIFKKKTFDEVILPTLGALEQELINRDEVVNEGMIILILTILQAMSMDDYDDFESAIFSILSLHSKINRGGNYAQ